MKFRKKPVVIEATQWFKNGDHPEDYAEPRERIDERLNRVVVVPAEHAREAGWEGWVVRRFRHPGVPGSVLCEECAGRLLDHGWIDTLEGGHRVCPGDWIITGVKGERYPCKPDIFAATYDAVLEEQEAAR